MIKLPLLKAKIEYQQQKESFLNQISYYFISNFNLFALFMKTIWILFLYLLHARWLENANVSLLISHSTWKSVKILIERILFKRIKTIIDNNYTVTERKRNHCKYFPWFSFIQTYIFLMLYRLHSKRLSKVINFARKYKEGCRRAIQIFFKWCACDDKWKLANIHSQSMLRNRPRDVMNFHGIYILKSIIKKKMCRNSLSYHKNR